MRKSILALASASAMLAFALPAAAESPAPSVAFPSLTTIYIGSGVLDDGGPDNTGTATSIQCSNVSGVSVQVRVLILGPSGGVEGQATDTVAHGATVTRATHLTNVYIDTTLNTGPVAQGALNIESTNSGVFCAALTINAVDGDSIDGESLRLVRVNPHPGTVE